MAFLWIFLGLIMGAGGGWYYFTRIKSKPPAKPPASEAKLKEGFALLESVHYLAFGPAGSPKQALVDAFNKLWQWGGLKQQGKP